MTLDEEREGLFLELERYQKLWAVLEDLETILWGIKGFNEALEKSRLD
ncbi:MAG: hypothetical protein H7249_00480 [Chitinophagaceae bacterium]|nr:hypothetical protein [Oligoflexus sp.]